MNLPYDLDIDIKEYCRVNKIDDVEKFTIKIIKKGFALEKYGNIPEEIVVKKNAQVKPKPILPTVEVTPVAIKKTTPKEKKKVEEPKPEIKTVEKNKGLYDED